MSTDSFRSGTLTADGQTNWFEHAGGRLGLSLQKTFGGGTAVLQASFDEGTTVGTVTDIVTGNTITVAAGTNNRPYLGVIEAPAGWYRFDLSGSTSPNLLWQIQTLLKA